MNLNNIKTWTGVLRSDEYRQGREVLAAVIDTEDGPVVKHCCLGVAAELAGVEKRFPGLARGAITFAGSRSFLPDQAKDWLGVTFADPFIDIPFYLRVRPEVDESPEDAPCIRDTCSGFNDSGFTFAQIADLIDYFGLTT